MSSLTDAELPRLTEEYRNRYERQGAWGQETFVDCFEATVEDHPGAEVVGPNRRETFVDLAEEVERVAAGLQRFGIGTGDVVSYQLPNWVTTSVVHLAVSRVGAVANPIIPIYRRSEVEYIVSDAGSKCVFVPASFRGFDYPEMIAELEPDCPELESMVVVGDTADRDEPTRSITYDELSQTDAGLFTPPELDANDIHALLYTSGTTADPKGVLHTHNTLLFENRKAVELLELSSESTVFMPSPVTHVTGLLYALELPFIQGMDLVLMDVWDPAEAVELIDAHDCNFTIGATPFLQGVNEHAPDDWDCPLHVFVCGGADIPPELVREATTNLDCTVQRVYGSTEYPTATWPPLDAPLDKLAETDGPPAPSASLKVVDLDDGTELPPGEKGLLLGHGPELMVGYLGAELNEESFDGPWFDTGDLAVIDEDGYVEITGRLKDIIVRGGENIPVKDVEDRLYEHPAVEEVAIVAMPDPEMQEKACAYVSFVDGESFTFEEMVEYLDGQGIAKQKYPERLEVVDSFPKTASGKIQKNVLRETIADELDLDPVSRE